MVAAVVNYPLVAGLLAFAVAQSAKFFTTCFVARLWIPAKLSEIFLLFLRFASPCWYDLRPLLLKLAIHEPLAEYFVNEANGNARYATWCESWTNAYSYRTRTKNVPEVCVLVRYKEKRWDARQFIASGGMPSSHSATVTALAVSVGIQEGFRSATFATSVILACVVMHDAFGVRLHAGKQAEVLNQIVYELPIEHPLAETKPLREILGHTVPQVVAGCILGILTAVIMLLALGSYT
uniref:Uncharacterized protein n=1 Tax=Aegilops tauschii TaxID=37682 RepID=M8AXS8_AEGTA